MLTYDLSATDAPLYQTIYQRIKEDISAGRVSAGTRMPSKRMLAQNLGVSTITVENAYDQLIGEGYLYALPKRGYFVADLSDLRPLRDLSPIPDSFHPPSEKDSFWFDFSSNDTSADMFPFSVWAKLMRQTISMRERELLTLSPCEGVPELREAIAAHLASFRGLRVDPAQLIVGAGTEYLYGLLIQLLGREKRYCTENPGYRKIKQIYESNGVRCHLSAMDDFGIDVAGLRESGAQIAHISPTHQFPTGITMPISRRYELLAWANEDDSRYIIEDDYDSEFRVNGRPIPTLLSIDAGGKVIYMNTFSKSLTATIRISYMVLPAVLTERFYQELSFYSNTVSAFEQYTLAAFIREGYFEKHINRARLQYGRKRARVLALLREKFSERECGIIENSSGLHFLLELRTDRSDRAVKELLAERGIRITAITEHYMDDIPRDSHRFILNYSAMDIEDLNRALDVIREVIFGR